MNQSVQSQPERVTRVLSVWLLRELSVRTHNMSQFIVRPAARQACNNGRLTTHLYSSAHVYCAPLPARADCTTAGYRGGEAAHAQGIPEKNSHQSVAMKPESASNNDLLRRPTTRTLAGPQISPLDDVDDDGDRHECDCCSTPVRA